MAKCNEKTSTYYRCYTFWAFSAQDTTKKWWAMYSHRYILNTCMSLKSRLQSKIASNWKLECPGTENFVIKIKSDFAGAYDQKMRVTLYKSLANAYVSLAKFSNLETLEMLLHLYSYSGAP